jgi:hypothetical protein
MTNKLAKKERNNGVVRRSKGGGRRVGVVVEAGNGKVNE